MSATESFDVVIVGSGLMGAAVAHELREQHPHTRIAMIAGGPAIGTTIGQHLHDVPEPEVWEQYNEKVSSGIQAFYTGVAPSPEAGATMRGVEPGMYHLSSLGEDARDMPSAAVGWNAGGMGVHWTAATPTPWGQEIPDLIPSDEWDRDLARAKTLLKVNEQPYPESTAGAAVRAVLEHRFTPVSAEGREVRDMPMAINDNGAGLKVRTSPSVIFPPIGDPATDDHFTLFLGALAISVEHHDKRATAVTCRSIDTDETFVVDAAQVIVCADSIRTPQLLFASGIRPEALGRYLNEHVFLTGLVIADPERTGFALDQLAPATDQEWASDCIWVPHSGEAQPFQTHLLNTVMVDDAGNPLAYGVGLEYYIPTDIQRDNRLEFSTTQTDAAGLPKITVHFDYTDDDRERIARARREQTEFARELGEFDPDKDAAVLDPGSSLHFTGTVRMGAADDGTSVCDSEGRVWGFENLYVVGCGVVPTALTCNSTLTGMTTAVRASAAVSSALAESASAAV